MDVNWIDAAIGGILLLSALGAVRNGATREVLRIAALIIGIFLAMWWYDRVALQLQPYIDEPRLAACAAFLLIFAGCLIAGAVFAWVLVKVWGIVGLRWFDRLLGAAFGLVRGLLIAAGVLLAVIAFRPFPGAAQTVAESKLAPWVLHAARAAAAAAPQDFQETFTDGFDRVREVWTGSRSQPDADLL